MKYALSIILDETMNLSITPKYYAVAKGHNPGIYTDWARTSENIKGFAGACYKSFKTVQDAQEYLDKEAQEYHDKNITNDVLVVSDSIQTPIINQLIKDL